MNKAVIIGIIIVIVLGVSIVSIMGNLDDSTNSVSESPLTTQDKPEGKKYKVELSESLSAKALP